MRPRFCWQLRSRSLELGNRTLIMGVLNVTPDSFYDGGKFLAAEQAIAHGRALLDEGADILDIGGESTRPGASVSAEEPEVASARKPPVTAEEERGRIMPVLQAIFRTHPDAIVSVDTYKSEVARAAVAAGAEIVNDVSGFLWDAQMASTCAELNCGVVLMHTRGTPAQWRNLSHEANLISVIERELESRVHAATQSGVERARIVLDPGFGFGKNFEENYPVLAKLHELQHLGFPLLAGTSRKSFVSRTVGKRLGRDVAPTDRLYGSLATMVASILAGAHIVRVHDVRPSVEAAAIADEVLRARQEVTSRPSSSGN